MRMIIKGGHVVDPGNISGVKDIIIENGLILDVKDHDPQASYTDADTVVDASGKTVTPGLIDMHVHLREPGFEYKETIESGCRAAVSGGFTTVCCMPNTNPVNDSRAVTEYIIKAAEDAGLARVLPVAAITPGLDGKGLCEYSDIKDAGAVAISDDGMPVKNGQVMRRAMEYAKGFDLLVISHCEDLELVAGGCINEGLVSARTGLAGIPNISESLAVIRDIEIAELTGARVHIAHVSTRESVRAIRDAKKRGVRVTAETAPHYFTLTDEAVEKYDTYAKMNPPLRSAEDRRAIREALADGTLDVIATDHAPHSILEKQVEFDKAANGIVGLETSLPLGLRLVDEGVLSLEALVEKMSRKPAAIIGMDNSLKPGNPADITIIDTEKTYAVDSETFYSKGRNTPFNGWEMKGRAVFTIVGGNIVYEDPLTR